MPLEIGVEYVFLWKIKNYSFCFDKVGETLISPTFTANSLNWSKWFLSLRPFEEGGSYNAECYLNRSKEDMCSEKINISFSFELIDGNSISICKVLKDDQTFLRGSTYGLSLFKRGCCFDNQNSNWNIDLLTIRCKIQNTQIRQESFAVTEIGTHKHSFLWKLNFMDCISASQKKNFSLSEKSQYTISVSAPGEAIEIQIEAAVSSQQFLHGKINLLNAVAAKVLSEKGKHLFNLEDDNLIWNFPCFISKKKLKSYLSNETFSLVCEFSAINGEESSDISSSDTSFQTNCKNALTLREDLSNLLTSSKHSDIFLRSGSETFAVHKSILATRSPVFSDMFDQNMIEKHSGIVDIPDIDPETLKDFLLFIYTGEVIIKDYKSASELFMIAKEYEILSLKDTCLNFIMSSISPENLLKTLNFAQIMNSKELKKRALDYFTEHRKNIMVLPEWTNLSKENTKLLKDMLSQVDENHEKKLEG